MTRLIVALMAVLAAAAAACSQGTEPVPAAETPEIAAPAAVPAGEVEVQIEQLEREWVAAITSRDAATLGRLLADGFVGTSPSAHIYDKTAALADLERGTYVVTSMELDEVSANVYGDTAVAFTSQEEQSTYGGIDTSGHYHYTNVWLRENGQWQVVASHGSKYTSAH